MPQNDFGNIDETTTSGPQLADLLEDWRDSVHSSHKGGVAPSYAVQGATWVDDSGDPVWHLKIYDGTDWITLLSIDTSANSVSLPGSASSVGSTTETQFLRSDADDFLNAVLEARYGIHGGYGSGGNAGSGATWGANIWGLGTNYDAAGYGASFTIDANYHGACWLRSSHANVDASTGEGLHVFQSGELVGAIGNNGFSAKKISVDGDEIIQTMTTAAYNALPSKNPKVLYCLTD